VRVPPTWPNRALLAVLVGLPVITLGFMPINSAEPFKVPAEAVIVCGAWVFLALAACTVPRLRFSTAQRWLACLLGWLGVSTLLAYNPASSLGYMITVGTYFALGFALVGWLDHADRAFRRGVIWLIAGLVAVETALGYVQRAGVDLAGWGAKVAPSSYFSGYMAVLGATTGQHLPIGSLGNVNYLAEFLVLCLPVLVGWALTIKAPALRWAAVLATLPAYALVVATACRAAMLGTVVGAVVAAIVVWGLAALDTRRWVATKGGGVTVAAVLGGLALGLATFGTDLFHKLHSLGSGDLNVTQRLVNWQAGVAIWRDHILNGAGLGGFKLLDVEKLRLLHPNGLPPMTGVTRFFQAHNEPVQLLAELGSVGMFFAVMALADWGKEVRENETLPATARFGLIWGCVALIVASCFGFPFHIPLTAFAFVLVVALGLARPTDEAEPAELRLWAGAVAVALGAACFHFGVGPLYQSSLDQQRAAKAADAGKYAEAAALYRKAQQANRFKASIITQELLALYHEKRYQEMVDLFDQNQREGLGMDAVTIKADGLAELGRKDEAIALYDHVMHYYSPDHPNYRRAASQIGHLQPAVKK
jgi:hypothetical protein